MIPQPEIGSSLSGVITDPNGAVIAGAILTLTNARSHVAFSFTTTDDGAYKFSVPEEGSYSLVVEAPGFSNMEMPELELLPNSNRTLNI